jgi:hypothetical protein
MSTILGEVERVNGAFDQPTLTLLHQPQARTVVAIFRSCFTRDRRSVPAALLHSQVEAHLDTLRQLGYERLPNGTGRELCTKWMKAQWLTRDTEETYALTSSAQEALALVKSLTRDRANLSEHRIATILTTVRRFNADVHPDRAERVRLLDADITRLTRERDRLLRGGEMEPVTDDYMLEGYNEILELVSALPSDFARVEEAFTRLRAEILAEFRTDERPAGQVLDDYLARVDTLMTATAEGRAFEGAFSLLRDPQSLEQLRADLQALLEHPQAGDILVEHERRNLRATVRIIQDGIQDVLARRTRVTAALRDYILTHDLTRDRELDLVLRQVDAELTTWMRTAGPRAKAPIELPPRAKVEHLRERFYDPANEAPPPPLSELDDDSEQLSIEELFAEGGPSLERLAQLVAAAFTDPAAAASLGDLFATFGPDLRRPVEVFGLLQEATGHPTLHATGDTETYATLRPDGTRRVLEVPRLAAAGPRPTAAAPDTTTDREPR